MWSPHLTLSDPAPGEQASGTPFFLILHREKGRLRFWGASQMRRLAVVPLFRLRPRPIWHRHESKLRMPEEGCWGCCCRCCGFDLADWRVWYVHPSPFCFELAVLAVYIYRYLFYAKYMLTCLHFSMRLMLLMLSSWFISELNPTLFTQRLLGPILLSSLCPQPLTQTVSLWANSSK